MNKIFLKGKMRNLQILFTMIYVLIALTFTFLRINDFSRNPDAFTVRAVFPQELAGVMDSAKIVESLPNNIPAIPADVSDIEDGEVVEVYQQVNCLPPNKFGFTGGVRNVCTLTLYVFRGYGLPVLSVRTEASVLFVDDNTSVQLSETPNASTLYYVPSGRPKVSGNNVTQGYKKNFVYLYSWTIVATISRLIVAWALFGITIGILRFYRQSRGIYI